jgi:ubiquinone/menaquinone biosynthesis C-methylase UbiE
MKQKNTSWGAVAKKYEEHLKDNDTYHANVVAPNVLRLVAPTAQMRILEIGCGEGYFTRLLSEKSQHVTGSDISPELIALAKKHGSNVSYHVANSEDLSFAKDESFDVVLAVLTLQNCEHIDRIFKECTRVLTKNGKLIFVLNHPSFRQPKKSSWGNAPQSQYRRIDGYMSGYKAEMVMNPGSEGKKIVTYSFHRPLQEYSKALNKAGFLIAKIEEWISHRSSEEGPKKEIEDAARKEIPLFMTLECVKK